jgi:hypothetical protein
MKTYIKNISLCLMALFTLSCQKTELEDLPADDPEFFLSGQLDQSDFLFQAGLSNYYQYTNNRSEGNVLYHEGYLQPICDEEFCGPGIMIRIVNKGNDDLRSIIETRTLSYYYNESGVPGEQLFEIRAWSNDSIYAEADYEWMIDNEISKGFKRKDTVTGPQQLICMTVTGQCASQICKTIHMENGSACETDLEFYITPGSDYGIEAMASGNGPFNFLWNNGTVGDSTIMYEEDGTQYLCATMMDANNCTALQCSQISFFGGQIEFCENQFSYSYREIVTPAEHGSVEIVYTDASGKSYFSSLVSQIEENFRVNDIENYDLNAEGDPTLRFNCDFSCVLAAEDGSMVTLNKTVGVFALAY